MTPGSVVSARGCSTARYWVTTDGGSLGYLPGAGSVELVTSPSGLGLSQSGCADSGVERLGRDYQRGARLDESVTLRPNRTGQYTLTVATDSGVSVTNQATVTFSGVLGFAGVPPQVATGACITGELRMADADGWPIAPNANTQIALTGTQVQVYPNLACNGPAVSTLTLVAGSPVVEFGLIVASPSTTLTAAASPHTQASVTTGQATATGCLPTGTGCVQGATPCCGTSTCSVNLSGAFPACLH